MVLEDIGKDYEVYLQYADKLCGPKCSGPELLSETYIKLHKYLTKHPEKIMSPGLVYVTIKSVFLNDRIKANQSIEYLDCKDNANDTLQERIKVNKALDELRFFDRAILLKTHEISLREAAKELNCNRTTIHNWKKEATEKLKKIWEKQEQTMSMQLEI